MRQNSPVDGLSYANYPLTSCEVAWINLVQPVSEGCRDEAWVSCNTSAGQSILIRTSDSQEGEDATNYDAIPLMLQTSVGANYNESTVTGQWGILLQVALRILAPVGFNSVFLPSVVSNNLSSIRIAYYGMWLLIMR